jgi:hypothetical protein
MTSSGSGTPSDGFETVRFDHLDIRWDRRVPEPERWTAETSHLAAAVDPECPPGPILELCDGVGQVGLLTASLTGRDLVQIEGNPLAASYAQQNAEAAAVACDVRAAALEDALERDERFAMAIVETPRTGSDRETPPEDPVHVAPDGTQAISSRLGIALSHLTPEGWCVVQVSTHDEAHRTGEIVVESTATTGIHRVVDEVRDCRPGGLLVLIGPGTGSSATDASTGGTVSEAYRGAGETVYPSDATAGFPLPDEDVQEGAAGPNARPRENSPDRRGDEHTR